MKQKKELNVWALPHYWKQDSKLSEEFANGSFQLFGDAGIDCAELVVKDEYKDEPDGMLHYCARVRVGEHKGGVVYGGTVLSDNYLSVSETEGTFEGSVKVVARLPANTPVETTRALSIRALDLYKELLEKYYPDWETKYSGEVLFTDVPNKR